MGRVFLLFAICAAAAAQSFEVASLKLHPGDITMSADPVVRGSRVVGMALTLVDLLTYAYDVRYEQISGAPGWASNDHYDLNAKAPGETPPTREQAKLMTQALLAERFHLQLHRETKELPVYALVVAKGGHKLTPSTADAKGNNVMSTSGQGLRLDVARGTMQRLAEQLTHSAGRPVVDRTGLAGYWAYKLDWMPVSNTPVDGPSMFTVLQEQLGLKLETARAPFDLLIIDHAEKPTDN